MKPGEILAALPQRATAKADSILASPAWAMPCRLGETSCLMRLDALRPADTLDVTIRLENERHVLSIFDTLCFPELHAIWSVRTEVPSPILLALVEKDCGPLLQLLENAARRQLKVEGLADEAAGPDEFLCAQLYSGNSPLLSFAITRSQSLVAAFGQLRFVDVSHASVRETPVSAEVEIASFVIPATDFASLSTGDALLIPECGTVPPRLVADGRFAIDQNGVSRFADDGRFRIVETKPQAMTLGEIFDAAASSAPELRSTAMQMPLRLVRNGKTLATGRMDRVADHPAMIIEAKE
ncbi:MAG: hypothetical protein J6W80_01620 [Kiritimatiellae bacterium]|nr:hypothetical protein [Kiritimatiellia bacterium]